jgi:cytidine deaminase
LSESELMAELIAAARAVRLNAPAGFSGFQVGAALESTDGAVFTGCNVESATYGQTMCAERVALFKALSEGHRAFSRIAIVTGAQAPTPPCGACRQMLWEYGGDLEIVLVNADGHETGRHRLADLFPLPFDRRNLE